MNAAVRFLSADLAAEAISLVPYTQVEGTWTLRDEVLIAFARTSQRERTFHRVFYEGQIRTPQDFVEIMQQPSNLPVFAFRGREPIGVAWLNSLCGNRAFAHFLFLKRGWGTPAVEACRMILDYWLGFEDAGEPVLDVIVGMIPQTNTRAVKFVERIGFRRLGKIPQILKDVYTGDRDSAVILYYSRFEHGRR